MINSLNAICILYKVNIEKVHLRKEKKNFRNSGKNYLADIFIHCQRCIQNPD